MPQYVIYDKETKQYKIREAKTRVEARVIAIKEKKQLGHFRIFKPKTFKELRKYEIIIKNQTKKEGG